MSHAFDLWFCFDFRARYSLDTHKFRYREAERTLSGGSSSRTARARQSAAESQEMEESENSIFFVISFSYSKQGFCCLHEDDGERLWIKDAGNKSSSGYDRTLNRQREWIFEDDLCAGKKRAEASFKWNGI